MHCVYILRNPKGKHYIGETDNLERRLSQHNSPNEHFTGHNGPWDIVVSSECESKSDACLLEKKLKSFKNPKYSIRFLLDRNQKR